LGAKKEVASKPQVKETKPDAQTKPAANNNKKPNVDYEIQIKTANEMSAGTDSNGFISLYGSDGELVDLQLKNGSNKNAFEKNNLDVFSLGQLADIGTVNEPSSL
jgi:hypothetical protein